MRALTRIFLRPIRFHTASLLRREPRVLFSSNVSKGDDNNVSDDSNDINNGKLLKVSTEELKSIKNLLKSELQGPTDTTTNTSATSNSQRRLLIGFTCKVCQKRSHRTMSHHAYHHGIVLIECGGCQSRHLIADNLGWFRDTPGAARKIEEGVEGVRRVTLEEEDLMEILKDEE